jgi:hypothetical protein
MEVENARLLAERPNQGASSSSWCEPLVGSLLERGSGILISLVGMLFDNLARFHEVAAELPPDHRTWIGPEDVARVRQLLLSDQKSSE